MQDRLRHVTEAPALLLRAGLGLGTRGRNRMGKHRKIAIAAALVAAGLTGNAICAATLTWDVNGATTGSGGTGNWNLSDPFWLNGSTSAYQAWADGNDAVLGGVAGTVTLQQNVALGLLTFDNQ